MTSTPTQHAGVLILGSARRLHRRPLRRPRQPEADLITGIAQGGQLMTDHRRRQLARPTSRA
jgi:hypothetical protein